MVDENDRFTGEYKEKELCHRGKGIHHRAFVVCLFNDKGEILLQLRKHKRWDKFWDVSAISHVLHLPTHDESYEEAARRSMKEEVGVGNISLKKVGGFNYFAEYKNNMCENEYCAVFTAHYTGDIMPNTSILYEYKWMKKEQFIEDCLINSALYTPWAILTAKELEKDRKNIPYHIGFIMDGNRRWAKKNNHHQYYGHKRGYEQIESIVDLGIQKNIPIMTFWAFSTENWKRSKEEVSYLMTLFRRFFASGFLKRLMKKGIRLQILGDLEPFPSDLQEKAKKVIEETKNNTQITMNIALNYGGHAEILQAVQKALKAKKKEITEDEFSTYLYTNGQVDPDLLVRTGGEIRLSGFLPWQSTYSELYFTDTLWPDFDESEFEKALEDYATRQRRFGK